MSRGASAAEVVEGAIQAARVHKERSWLEQELSNTQGMLQTGDNDPQRVEQLKGDIAFITRSLHKIELSAQLQELETTEEARGDEVEMSEMATSSQAEMTASPKEGLRVDLSEAIKDAGSPMLSPIRAQAASFTLDADSPMVGDFISTI